MASSISYINLSWAVVGIIDKDVNNSLQSMKRPDEPIDVTIERYVLGYLAFWHIAYIDKEKMNRCEDQKVIELGRKKLEEYITSHPPVATLPSSISFLKQPQIGCDAYSLRDFFCVLIPNVWGYILIYDSKLLVINKVHFNDRQITCF